MKIQVNSEEEQILNVLEEDEFVTSSSFPETSALSRSEKSLKESKLHSQGFVKEEREKAKKEIPKLIKSGTPVVKFGLSSLESALGDFVNPWPALSEFDKVQKDYRMLLREKHSISTAIVVSHKSLDFNSLPLSEIKEEEEKNGPSNDNNDVEMLNEVEPKVGTAGSSGSTNLESKKPTSGTANDPAGVETGSQDNDKENSSKSNRDGDDWWL